MKLLLKTLATILIVGFIIFCLINNGNKTGDNKLDTNIEALTNSETDYDTSKDCKTTSAVCIINQYGIIKIVPGFKIID